MGYHAAAVLGQSSRLKLGLRSAGASGTLGKDRVTFTLGHDIEIRLKHVQFQRSVLACPFTHFISTYVRSLGNRPTAGSNTNGTSLCGLWKILLGYVADPFGRMNVLLLCTSKCDIKACATVAVSTMATNKITAMTLLPPTWSSVVSLPGHTSRFCLEYSPSRTFWSPEIAQF